MESLRNKLREAFEGEDEIEISDSLEKSIGIVDEIETVINEVGVFLEEFNKIECVDCEDLLRKIKEVNESLY